nr:reverse transcriptase domain-containing protein [Tanacetum cinerariifolium]
MQPRWENDPGKLGTALDFIESDQSSNPTSSTNQNPKGRNRGRSKQRVENSNLEEHSHPVVTMADQRTMAQLLQAPTEGYEDAIVVPAITANNFELKHGLFTLVQNKQFFGHDKEDPHAHICYFNKITSTLKFPNVPNTSIKLMLFPFSSKFFPPSKTTSLRNEITNFQQRFDESFSKAWDRFKDLLRACPHHGFLELHHLDTFYNALNSKDQDSLNSTAGGLVYEPSVFQQPAYQALAYQAPAPQTHGISKEYFSAYIKANDAMTKNMQTQCQNLQNQLTNLIDLIMKFVNSNSASTSSSGTLPSNTIANPKSDLKAITTRNGVSYDGPQIPPLVVENKPEVKKYTVNPTNNENTKDVQPQAVQSKSPVSISEPAIASKLSEMDRTPLNEHCSAVLLKKLPEKLGDLGKFLIPCDFPGMAECLALAGLGASINLMLFSVWKRLSLPDLTPTCMTLELADYSISHLVGVAEDVYVKVGSLYFSADFVVVDFDADPRVPLILGRSFIKTRRDLIDVFKGTFERCMMVIFHEMIEKTMEVMDDFSVFGNSFQSCLSYLEKMLKRPMTRLLENDTPFIFSQECIDAFQTLKRKLTEAPILIALDWDMPFELMCDASDFAIGAVLGQRQDKHFRPIHYANKTMIEAESNYTMTEKEMLAVQGGFAGEWVKDCRELVVEGVDNGEKKGRRMYNDLNWSQGWKFGFLSPLVPESRGELLEDDIENLKRSERLRSEDMIEMNKNDYHI